MIFNPKGLSYDSLHLLDFLCYTIPMIEYITAGESHGQAIIAIMEGVPAGLSLKHEDIDRDLARRQMGYGRGERMKIERDRVKILSGVRHGLTIGSPITMMIENRDWANWQEVMSVEPIEGEVERAVTRPRPGHADLAGALKYGREDMRDILERSSARETVARVALGAVAKAYLACLGIHVVSFLVELGGIRAEGEANPLERFERAEASGLRTFDPGADEKMRAKIDEAREKGETLGGVFEVVALGVPPGLGSHTQWNKRLDGRLAQAIMSIPAIKGVEIGLGFESARRFGSQVHDEIYFPEDAPRPWPFRRRSNNAGGLEGGITNGEPVVVRAAMKPLSTLRKPLESVDVKTKEAVLAHFERSDICAVPAAAVVGEAMVALELAKAVSEKFGGDSMEEVERNYRAYLESLGKLGGTL
mgnify:CR=1 FL=1